MSPTFKSPIPYFSSLAFLASITLLFSCSKPDGCYHEGVPERTLYGEWTATYDVYNGSEIDGERLRFEFFADSFHLDIIRWSDTLQSPNAPCNTKTWINRIKGTYSTSVNVLRMEGEYVDSTYQNPVANPDCSYERTGDFNSRMSLSVCPDEANSCCTDQNFLLNNARMTWQRVR